MRPTPALAMTLLLAVVGCSGDPERPTDVTPIPPAPPPVTPVASVESLPAQFYGKDVRLVGEVAKLHGDRGFELDGAGWAFNDNITVLTAGPITVDDAPLAARDELVVTGVVRPFVISDLERSLGWDLPPELESQLKDRPVLVADAIRKIGERGRWNSGGDPRPISSLGTIVSASNLGSLADRPVDLPRERVLSVAGKGLWVGPSAMSQIYVLPHQLPADIQPGDTVRITGTLKNVPGDAASLWSLPLPVAPLARTETLYIDKASVTELPTAPGA